MSYKVSMIQEHLQNMNDDTNLIYLDADIHIRQDVVTHMNDELDWSKQDILFQSDDGDPCAGMFICKNSNGIRNFFVEVYETMHSNREYYAQRSADQTAAFDVLKRGKIKYGFLSDRFTTYGNLRTNKNEYIQLRQVYINREKAPFTSENIQNYNIFNAKYGNFQSEGTQHFSILNDLQLSHSFGKVATELHFRKLFKNNRQISFRLYAGAFVYNNTNTTFFSFGLDRPNDYMFDYNLLGRSETTGIYSQQYVYGEGGFKSKLESRFANQWITTANGTFNIWNWVQIYGDLGMVKNKSYNPKFVYDSGFHLNLVPDYFELFLPVYSSNGFSLNDPNYSQQIRFVVTLSPKTLLSLFTRKWF